MLLWLILSVQQSGCVGCSVCACQASQVDDLASLAVTMQDTLLKQAAVCAESRLRQAESHAA